MSNNQDLGAAYHIKYVAVTSVFSGLATVAVALRLWARRIKHISLELNDYFIIFGLLCALGESAINIYGLSFGITKHMSQEDIMRAIIFSQKSQFMSIIIWVTSVTFIRASVVFLYIRLFPIRIFRRICYSVLVANLVFFLSTVLADCLICRPISYRWDLSRIVVGGNVGGGNVGGGTGYCGHEKPLDLYIGIFNLLLDVAAVVLPMPVLWGLNMDTGKKVKLSGMFGLGIAICAITLYRIYHTTTITPANAQDAYAVIAMLTTLEALLGVINACLPILKPVFDKMRGVASRGGDSSSGVREILQSGTIPIFMAVSQMFSRKERGSSSNGGTLAETSAWNEDEERMKRKKEKERSGESDTEGRKEAGATTMRISPPMTDKVERVMGIKTYEIHVRRDVDVESVASRDERRGQAREGSQERW